MRNLKLISIVTIIVIVCTLCACASSNNGSESGTPNSESPEISENGNLDGDDSVNNTPGESSTIDEGADDDESSSQESIPNESPSTDEDENEVSTEPGDNTNSTENGNEEIETAADMLAYIIDEIKAAEVWMPMSMPISSAPLSERHNAIGLSDADYEQYVITDAHSMAGITTQAHQIIVFQCVDAAAATQVKTLVSSSGGYDPEKWICVYPEKVVAIEAGVYVLLVASYVDVAELAVEIFCELLSDAGDAVVFWEHAAG
ncbi:MAG: hypothetical protein FWG88_01675 [Oscillospiraceae bacterium]|nr:hypothetical protein [Oscillospiraceae bacterium]